MLQLDSVRARLAVVGVTCCGMLLMGGAPARCSCIAGGPGVCGKGVAGWVVRGGSR